MTKVIDYTIRKVAELTFNEKAKIQGDVVVSLI